MPGVSLFEQRTSGVRLTTEDQIAILARLREGEREALEETARQHGPRLLGLAHRLLAWDGGEAEDVVQEVFARMLAHPRKIPASGDLLAWLIAVTANECRSHRRKLRSLLRTLRQKPVAADAPAADENALRDETHAGVRRAVGKLAQRDREVIVLRYLEQMAVDEIAVALRLTKNAVEVRLHRARERLKEFLDIT